MTSTAAMHGAERRTRRRSPASARASTLIILVITLLVTNLPSAIARTLPDPAPQPHPAPQGRVSASASPRIGHSPRARWRWPLESRTIARRFDRPEQLWGSGHRGLDLRGADGDIVQAVADGEVSYVGVIAGIPVMSVRHRDGIRSTYQPVVSSLKRGAAVRTGQPLGTLMATGSHCSPSPCLHLGAISQSRYLDPYPLLVRSRIRLLPLRR